MLNKFSIIHFLNLVFAMFFIILFQAAIDRNSIHSLTTELAEVRRNLADKEEQLSGLQSKCSQIQATSTDKALLLRAESRVSIRITHHMVYLTVPIKHNRRANLPCIQGCDM